ncbi:hypothetical protein ENUP19_0194G0011 [Entamoeba nuttalli]|uniref:Uncharacterized protein n=1 Tax=Entamoeba nuttalli TaxID=412467 RepID=A0ABQ0DNE0_9EUKA
MSVKERMTFIFYYNDTNGLLIIIKSNIEDATQFLNNTVSIVFGIHNVFDEIKYNDMLLGRNKNNE